MTCRRSRCRRMPSASSSSTSCPWWSTPTARRFNSRVSGSTCRRCTTTAASCTPLPSSSTSFRTSARSSATSRATATRRRFGAVPATGSRSRRPTSSSKPSPERRPSIVATSRAPAQAIAREPFFYIKIFASREQSTPFYNIS